MIKIDTPGMAFLVFEKLHHQPHLRHGVSICYQNLNAADKTKNNSEINFSRQKPQQKKFALTQMCAALRLNPESVVQPQQLHGAEVAVVREASVPVGSVDAVCSNIKGITLMLVGADCPLVVAYEPQAGALGLAHAGWRGTVQKITAKLVRRMKKEFGAEPERMRAGIGPGICGVCYEVGPDVAEAFRAQFDDTSAYLQEISSDIANHLRQPDDGLAFEREEIDVPAKWHLDLSRANQEQLVREGVPKNRIEVSNLCTFERKDWFYSYRRDGEKTGRNALLAGLI